jgi:DNA-directed RNA polymerase specialized sigma24 family protein
MEKDDLALLCEGNPGIWIRIYTEYRRKCYAWASRNTSVSRDDMEDAFQEVAKNIHFKATTGDLKALNKGVENYIFISFRNKLINDLRHRIDGIRCYNHLADISEHCCCIDLAFAEDTDPLWQLIMRCYNELTPTERKLFDLCQSRNTKLDHITAAMGYKNDDVTSQRKFKLIKKIIGIIRERRWMDDL